MKSKKFNKKLVLKKEVISKLNLSKVKGGEKPMDTHIDVCVTDEVAGGCHTLSCAIC
jgi:hypothetical protein